MTLPPGPPVIKLRSAEFLVPGRPADIFGQWIGVAHEVKLGGPLPTVTFDGYIDGTGTLKNWPLFDKDGDPIDMYIRGAFSNECPVTVDALVPLMFPYTSQWYSPDADCKTVFYADPTDHLKPLDLTYSAVTKLNTLSLHKAVDPFSVFSSTPTITGLTLTFDGWPGTSVSNAWIKFSSPGLIVTHVQRGSGPFLLPVNGYFHLGTIENGSAKAALINFQATLNNCTPEVNIPVTIDYGYNCFGFPPDFPACFAGQGSLDVYPEPSGMSMTVTPQSQTGVPCDTFDYVVRITSTQLADLENPQLTITLPAGMSFIKAEFQRNTDSSRTLLARPTGNVFAWNINQVVYNNQGMPPTPAYLDLFVTVIGGCADSNPQLLFQSSGETICGGALSVDVNPSLTFTKQPDPSATATVAITPVTDCTSPLSFAINLGNITHPGNLIAKVHTTYNSAFILASSVPQAKSTAPGTTDWVIDPVSGTSLNITADLSIPAGFCDTFPLTVVVDLIDETSCCTNTVQYTITTNEPICCTTNCCEDCTEADYISYNVTVNPGVNYLANHLCQGTNNTIEKVLPTVPDGAIFYDWDEAAQAYSPAQSYFTGVGWLDPSFNPSTDTLDLGEGFVLNNPGAAFTLTIQGCDPAGCLLPCLPSTNLNDCVLVGRYGIGTATWMNLSRCDPECGTRVSIWDSTNQVFGDYDYVNGVWTPQIPVLAVGESAFVCLLANTNCCELQVLCASNKVVECGTAWTFDSPTVLANCCTNFTLEIVSTLTNRSDPCETLITRSWLVTDCETNSATCTQTVRVVDTTPPVITCANNKTVECGTSWTFDLPTAYDVCCTNVTVELVSSNLVTGPCPDVWQGIWQAIDCCTNISTCTQTVTVVDTTPPVITDCSNLFVLIASGQSSAVVNYGVNATDACANPVTLSCTPPAGSFPPGIHPVTCVAVDACGNSNTCQFTITVSTNCCDGCEPPYPASYTVTVTPGVNFLANHLCQGTNNTFGDLLSSVPVGSQVQKWNGASFVLWTRVGFGAGWSPSGGATETLDPGEGFVLNNASGSNFPLIFEGCEPTYCPIPCLPTTNGTSSLVGRLGIGTATWTNLSRCDPECGTRVSIWNGSAYDDYDYVNGAWTPPLPSLAIGQSAFVNLLANSNCCELQLLCASNQVVECGTAWSFNPPTVLTNCCTNVTIAVVSTLTNSSVPCATMITRSWEATDCNAHSATCTQTVTVVDTTPPTMTCAGDQTVECGTDWTFDIPQVFDACCGTNVTLAILSTQTNGLCPQVTTRIWQATDCCGNVATCTQVVTVVFNGPQIVPNIVTLNHDSTALHLIIQTQPCNNYVFECKTSLSPSVPWTVCQTAIGDGTNYEFIDPAPLPTTRFYRVRLLCP